MANTRSRCDPCGIVCILFIYLIVIYTDYAFVNWIIIPLDVNIYVVVLTVFVFQLIIILLVWSHVKASTSDPGVVPHPQYGLDFSTKQLLSDKEDSDHNWSVCVRCEMYRPPRAHHCRICKRCIRKMDHHCPWINNCVGELNQKYFIQFLLYTGLACIYTLISIIFSFIKLKQDSQQRMIHTSILLIESLLFGLFVVAVLTDQVQAIFNNETAIEKHMNKNKVKTKSKRLLTEVCGPGPMIWWLFPCRTNKYSSDSHYIV